MVEVRIPDLGDFDEVEVVEIHVAKGDTIQEGDPILTLETEKAAMDGFREEWNLDQEHWDREQ